MDAWTSEDRKRMAPSRAAVLALMEGGAWWPSDKACQALGLRNLGTFTSRVRDLAAYFQWCYEKRRGSQPGVWEYRLFRPGPSEQLPLL